MVKQGGATTYRRQVAGAIVRFEPDVDLNVTNSPRAYRFTDHLGSPVALHRVNNDVWHHRRFEVFGTRTGITAGGGGGGLYAFLAWTDRGFTGHESIQGAGIVHMQGRIYDPGLGRFLQADPSFVQAPDNSQNLNRYTDSGCP